MGQLKQSDLSDEIYRKISTAINKISEEYFLTHNSKNRVAVNVLGTLED